MVERSLKTRQTVFTLIARYQTQMVPISGFAESNSGHQWPAATHQANFNLLLSPAARHTLTTV